MNLYLLLTLLLSLFFCKPDLERSQLPTLEVLSSLSRSSNNSTAAPLTLSYSPNSTVLTQNLSIGSITPTTTGSITACTISPSLPAGLSLSSTCVLSGTPTTTQPATGYTITASNNSETVTATINISVIALPSVSFNLASSTGSESVTAVTIPVTLSYTFGATVNYSVTGGTASGSGTDFTLTAGTLTFTNGGATTQNISLTINNDTLDEADETIIITLSGLTNAVSGANTAHTYTITDDDAAPTVQFTAASQTATESAGTVTITAGLSAVSGLPVSIPFSINGSSTATSASDYTITASPLSIPAGSTTATISVTIVSDSMHEPSETIIADIGSPTNATTSGTTSHTITITDDDTAPTVQFTAATQIASESTSTITITAQLSAASGFAVSVPFSVNAGSTATGGGTDYSISASPLSIPAGSTALALTITINNDALYELSETVVVDMGSPTNATASGTTSHTATITDDDPMPTVQFTAASQSAAENVGTFVMVGVQPSAVSGVAITVPITINAGSTAINGTDYTGVPASITIPAGASSSSSGITLTNDTLYEADETIILDIGTPTNATASGTLTHTVTITNDDAVPTVAYTAGITNSAGEGIGNYGMSLTLSAASGLNTTVTVNTADGTATAGSDYTQQSAQIVIISAGSTTASLNIPITEDLLYEGNETFTITMSSPTNSTISGGTTQTVTITENDIGVVSAETLDCAGNGKIDHYKVTFTSAITDSTFPGYALNSTGTASADWIVAGYSNASLEHGTAVNTACGLTDTANDAILYLRFTEGGSYDTGAKPDLTTSANPIASGGAGTVARIFTATVTEADTAKPIVTSITPANGAVSVLVDTNITAVFSENMNTTTFNSTNFYLTGAASVPGAVSTVSVTSAMFDPTANLAVNQAHTVTINNMTDANGNVIVAFTSGFTTSPPVKLLGTVNSSSALNAGLVISNSISTVSVTAGGTSTLYQSLSNLIPGTTYSISITTQPFGQYCTLIDTGNLSGVVGATDITVDVNCVSGYMSGGTGLQTYPLTSVGFHLYQGNTTLFAGANASGNSDLSGSSARFNIPIGITSDGTNLYVTDHFNHKVRKIDSAGNVTTFAGNGTAGNTDGTGSISSLNYPRAIATDGTYIYVSEYGPATGGQRIKRIRISTGNVDTLVGDNSTLNPTAASLDGTGTVAKFNEPAGMVIENGIIYLAERSGNKIRKIDTSTKIVTTLSTGGSLVAPEGISLVGTYLYVSCINSHRILKIDKTTGAQVVFAGTGSTGTVDAIGTSASFSYPHGIATDGSYLFVVDQGNARIRQIEIATQKVTTLAGNAGGFTQANGVAAAFNAAAYVFSDGKALFATDQHSIRKITNNGLVAYYPLVNGAIDYSGSNNGTLINAPAFTTTDRKGIANQAITLNGSQSISASDSGLPNLGAPRSACAWIRPTLAPNANQTILSYGTGNANQAFGLVLNGDGTNITTVIQSVYGTAVSVKFKVQLNLWTHICGTYTGGGAGNMSSLYINGKLVAQGSSAAFNTVLGQLRIGYQLNGTEFFNGSIADVRIYSRVLNEGEINELAQNAVLAQVGASMSTGATGLLGQYAFGNGNLNDFSPLGNTLTINGTATATGINGKDGDTNGAYNFSMNSGQYLNGSTNGLPLSNAPRTICVWVKPDQVPNNSVIVSYGTGSPNSAFGLTMYTATDFRIWNWTAGDLSFTLPVSIPLNTWSHFCGTFDGTNATAYWNGKSLGTQAFGTAVSTTAGVFRVGANVNSASTFPGKIDDVRIYNNAIPAIAARQLATQVPTGLVARFDFNGDTKDASGFGADGAINGTVAAAADRFGNTSSAYRFTNVLGNKITAPDTFLPMGANPRTMCMWFRNEYVAFETVLPFGYGNTAAGLQVIGIWLEAQNIVRLWGQGADVNANVKTPNNIWYHTCATYDGTTGQVYVNGRFAASAGQALNTVSTGLLSIGSHVTSREFMGTLDDMRIYNRVLSASEIQALSGYHPMQLAGWNPAYAGSSLKFHLQAESLGNLANNASITTWADASNALAGTATYANSIPPTFLTSGINSKPAVNFDPNNSQYFNFTGSTVQSTTSSFFAVLQRNSAGTAVSLLTNMGMTGLYESYFDNTGIFYLAKNGIGGMVGSTAVFNSTAAPYLISQTHNQPGNTGSVYSAETGVLSGGSYSLTPDGVPTNFNLGAPTCLCGAPANFFNGKISEVLYFNQVLSNTDRVYVSCYLSAKYSIPLASGVVCP